MERLVFPRCGEDQRASCKYAPDCERLQETEHHLRARELLKIARKHKETLAYQAKLKKVIYHTNNLVYAPRCAHDDLDRMSSRDRIPEPELDRLLKEWKNG